MENAIDALKMAFGMLVFVMALTLAIRVLGMARETADVMLTKADPTTHDEYVLGTGDLVRTVGLETIIPSLYKYYKEDYMVVFQERNGDPYKIYRTQTNSVLWSDSYTNLWNGNYNPATDVRFNGDNGYDIACFDVEEETARREPWTANADIYFKRNLDAILYGTTFVYPDGSGRSYNYGQSQHIGTGGLIEALNDTEFDEYIGEITYEVFNEYSQRYTNKTKRVIIYREK